jgi:hypothetical protein
MSSRRPVVIAVCVLGLLMVVGLLLTAAQTGDYNESVQQLLDYAAARTPRGWLVR